MPWSPKAEATRNTILDAAEQCFAERGFKGASTRAISTLAGVTQPLVVHYFGSKDALFDCVLERCVADFGRVQAPQFALAPEDLDFFVVGLRVLFEWGLERPALVRLFAWARLEGRLRANEASAAMHRRVVEHVAAAQQAGLVRPSLDPEMVLLTVDVAFKGYWDRRHAYAEAVGIWHEAPTLDALDRDYFRTTIEVLLRGVLIPDVHDAALARL